MNSSHEAFFMDNWNNIKATQNSIEMGDRSRDLSSEQSLRSDSIIDSPTALQTATETKSLMLPPLTIIGEQFSSLRGEVSDRNSAEKTKEPIKDASGRISIMKSSDGMTSIKLKYDHDGKGALHSIEIADGKSGIKQSWTKTSRDNWHVDTTDNGKTRSEEWRGTIKAGPDGIKLSEADRLGRSGLIDRNGRRATDDTLYTPDGKKCGLHVEHSKDPKYDDRLQEFTRPDGSSFAFANEHEKSSRMGIFSQKDTTGKTTIWHRKSDSWVSPDCRDELNNITADGNGKLEFNVKSNGQHIGRDTVLPDGKHFRKTPDAAVLELDAHSRVTKIFPAHGSPARCVSYSPDGSIKSVTGHVNGKEQTIFQAADPQTKNAQVDNMGNLKYDVVSSDGKNKRHVEEMATGVRRETDAAGHLLKWSFASGDKNWNREFKYSADGKLDSIKSSIGFPDHQSQTTVERIPGATNSFKASTPPYTVRKIDQSSIDQDGTYHFESEGKVVKDRLIDGGALPDAARMGERANVAKERLVEAAREAGLPAEALQSLKQDATDLHRRASTSKGALSMHDTENVFDQARDILTLPARGKHLEQRERLNLVSSLMHNLAHPDNIRPGKHGNSQLANADRLLAERRPAGYAQRVADMALVNRCGLMDGKPLKPLFVPDNLLHAGPDEQPDLSKPAEAGRKNNRNIASQYMQAALLETIKRTQAGSNDGQISAENLRKALKLFGVSH